MRRIVSLGVVMAGLVMSLGCCHTCDVCDDCGGCDSHYGVYSSSGYGAPGCATCGTDGYAQKTMSAPIKSTRVAGPVHSTVKTR
jgi:hypothetical protein